MPAWSRRSFLAAAAGVGLACVLPPRAAAEGITLLRAELNLMGEIWYLAGGYQIELSPTLEDALRRGVQLTFVQTFRAQRPRIWWLAEDIAEVSRVIRLSYNALLRQYYATVSGHTTAHASLADALDYIGDFNDWAVLHQSQVSRKHQYVVGVRMALDVTQLPKPLQVSAVASQRWQLDSGWREWNFRP
ncbi:MAG: DUF4390 domain-containing protein [Thiobacillaceae bacterium]|nr:DUF4390 domain-containing protein [Thiobacillaceae bacterium]MCX7673139.1 DUF4390 domain-containing protein [Thiobacillaceae bacterium]MDW8322904.1 DUF4390 domain-containing protein [Burkholderiales bacterium]